MGGVLGSLAEEGVDEYMSCEDNTPEIEIDASDNKYPRTFRLKNFPADHLQSADGSTSGRVAHALVSYSASRADVDHDLDTPNTCCLALAFAELVEQFHESIDAQMLKIPKSKEAVCWCISRGYPVAMALPVTDEIGELDIAPPAPGQKPMPMPAVRSRAFFRLAQARSASTWTASTFLQGRHTQDTAHARALMGQTSARSWRDANGGCACTA